MSFCRYLGNRKDIYDIHASGWFKGFLEDDDNKWRCVATEEETQERRVLGLLWPKPRQSITLGALSSLEGTTL